MTGRIIAGGLSLTRIYTRPLAKSFLSNMAQRIQLSTAKIFTTNSPTTPSNYYQKSSFSTKQLQLSYAQPLKAKHIESDNDCENKNVKRELSFEEFVKIKMRSFEEFCQSPYIQEACKGNKKEMQEAYKECCKSEFHEYKQKLYGGNSMTIV